jgi:multidrug efflux pump subunit AcrA (membrane-fusion protein)
VTIGIRTLDRVEITSGLKGGESVVVEGSYALPDGSKVKISEPEETESEEKKD